MIPVVWKRLHRPRHRQPQRLPPSQYCLNYFWCQQRQAQYSADVGGVDVLGVGDFFEGLVVAFLQRFLPAETMGKGLEQGAATRGRGCWVAVVPFGAMMSFRPPRLRIVNGTTIVVACSVMPQPSGPSRTASRSWKAAC